MDDILKNLFGGGFGGGSNSGKAGSAHGFGGSGFGHSGFENGSFRSGFNGSFAVLMVPVMEMALETAAIAALVAVTSRKART